MFRVSHGQDRTWGGAHDALRHAADEHVGDARAAVCAEDNQIDLRACRVVGDHFGRVIGDFQHRLSVALGAILRRKEFLEPSSDSRLEDVRVGDARAHEGVLRDVQQVQFRAKRLRERPAVRQRRVRRRAEVGADPCRVVVKEIVRLEQRFAIGRCDQGASACRVAECGLPTELGNAFRMPRAFMRGGERAVGRRDRFRGVGARTRAGSTGRSRPG